MSLKLRSMATDDIELGMRLKRQAGWNQTAADWRRFLDMEPDGCFVAEWNDQPVATTTTCTFGPVGWIAMVLVDESSRHRGIATRLIQRALDYLDERSVATVRLDATRYGRPVYERIGFVAEHDLVRLQGIAPPATPVAEPLPVCADQLDLLAEVDRRATGTNRKRLLEQLVKERPECARQASHGQAITGYVMLRPGEHATQIGPAVAMTEEAGRILCNWGLSQTARQPILIDIPVQNGPAIDWAQEQGLVEQRRFTRMFRGQPVEEDNALLWASSGPEKG